MIEKINFINRMSDFIKIIFISFILFIFFGAGTGKLDNAPPLF